MKANIEDLTLTESADTALAQGDHLRALAGYVQLLKDDPTNIYVWYATALQLGRLGDSQVARGALIQASGALSESGHLLLALAAAQALEQLDQGAAVVMTKDIATVYGAGSKRLGARRRSVPPPMPEQVHLDDLDDLDDQAPAASGDQLMRDAAAACAEAAEAWQDRPTVVEIEVPFHPLFSDLAPDDLAALAPLLQQRLVPAGEELIRQGDEGQSFFVVVRGSVKVTRTTTEGEVVHLATLGSDAFFGEMALLTDSPRIATVTALHPTVVFELGRRALEGLAARNPGIAEVLADYTRDRLLRNLLASSPLFRPLQPDRREKLAKIFHNKVAQPGEVVLDEGVQSEALYVVLSGGVVVSRKHEGGDITIAEMGPGDIFGEISMIQHRPTTAAVTAVHKSVILYLNRADFDIHVAEYPEVLTHVYNVAVRRERENVKIDSGPVIPVDESSLLI